MRLRVDDERSTRGMVCVGSALAGFGLMHLCAISSRGLESDLGLVVPFAVGFGLCVAGVRWSRGMWRFGCGLLMGMAGLYLGVVVWRLGMMVVG